MTWSSQGAMRNERVQISQCIGESKIPDWSWDQRHGVDLRFTRLGELDRSLTDPRVLNGIMNDVRCLIGICTVKRPAQ